MAEKLYTIPVNEAFDRSLEDPACGCPFCTLYTQLENRELDSTLGAAMMEPDIRIKMNHEGFCRAHYDMMLNRPNKLSLALILESHLSEEKAALSPRGLAALRGKGSVTLAELERKDKECYICAKLDEYMARMTDTAVYLWQTEPDFKKKALMQPYYCLPHFKLFLTVASKGLDRREYGKFYDQISALEDSYLKKLGDDVSWFCKKFDYRYDEEPWYNSKDACERAARFMTGAGHREMDKKEKKIQF